MLKKVKDLLLEEYVMTSEDPDALKDISDNLQKLLIAVTKILDLMTRPADERILDSDEMRRLRDLAGKIADQPTENITGADWVQLMYLVKQMGKS